MKNAVGLRDSDDDPPLSRFKGLELDETQAFVNERNDDDSKYKEIKENTLIVNNNNVSNFLP